VIPKNGKCTYMGMTGSHFPFFQKSFSQKRDAVDNESGLITFEKLYIRHI
jgi:hypothetical protein